MAGGRRALWHRLTGEGTSATSAADSFSYSSPAPTTTSPPASPRPRLRSGGHQLKVSGRRAGVPLSCAGARCHGTLRITEQIVVWVRHGKKTIRRKRTIVFATTSYTLGTGHHATQRARLDAAALKALSAAKRHRLSVRVTATVTGGTTLKESATLISDH